MIVGILASWRTPDHRWLVDRVYGEGDYRVFAEGELAAELYGPLERLQQYLTRHGVDIADLIPLAEGDDPWAE